MNLARRQAARHWAVVAEIATAGGALMIACLVLTPWITLAMMGVASLAIVQGWRYASRVLPISGEQ